MFVWNAGGASSYAPAPPQVNYKDLCGGTSALQPGRPVSIGVKLIMLEAAN